jgi:hypothetical protein
MAMFWVIVGLVVLAGIAFLILYQLGYIQVVSKVSSG